MSTDEYHSSAVIYNYCISPLLQPVRRDIRTYIHYKGYRQIIDFGCGTGDQLRLLDDPGMSLCGIDKSLAMLEQARRNCSDRINLHLLDAERDLVDSGSFDCAIISFGLHEKHPAVADTIFKNCRRVVRQGGALVLVDYTKVPSTLPGRLYSVFLIPLIERLAGKMHNAHYHGWMQRGGLEGFLRTHRSYEEIIEIISRPFDGAALCCAIIIDDDLHAKTHSYALLNQSLTS